MRLEITAGPDRTELELPVGQWTVGGSPEDTVYLDGLPYRLVTLTVKPGELMVLGQRPLRIGSSLFPAKISRLLLPGEAVTLPNQVSLRRLPEPSVTAPRQQMETAFVAHSLLSGALPPERSTRAASLTCVTGMDRGMIFTLPYDDSVVGRGGVATVSLRDRSVSREHARVVRRGKQHFLKPVASAMNATYVNGKVLRRELELQTGDTVEMGQTVLRFEAAEPAPGEQTQIEPNPLPVPIAAEPQRPFPTPSRPSVNWELVLMRTGVGLGVLGLGLVLLSLQ